MTLYSNPLTSPRYNYHCIFSISVITEWSVFDVIDVSFLNQWNAIYCKRSNAELAGHLKQSGRHQVIFPLDQLQKNSLLLFPWTIHFAISEMSIWNVFDGQIWYMAVHFQPFRLFGLTPISTSPFEKMTVCFRFHLPSCQEKCMSNFITWNAIRISKFS